MSGGSLQLYEYPTDVVRLSCAKCGGGMREAGDFIGVFNHCALKSAIACSRVMAAQLTSGRLVIASAVLVAGRCPGP